MRLSVCCVTSRPDRAARVLAPLRPVADEVLVAVDCSGGELDLTPLAPIADRVFEIGVEDFIEQVLPWLHAQCGGDWIFRVDDDEVVSPALAEQLPELIRARDVLQYWVARRWLCPDPGHWLEQWPWYPDFQGRLVRNDGRAWVPGRCHSSIELALPARYIEACLYHLQDLVVDRAGRERKVAGYLAVDPRLRDTHVDPYLESYYLPERQPELSSSPVPAGDRPAIEAVLAPPAPSPGSGPNRSPRTRRVGAEEISAHWPERELDPGAYRATISTVDGYRHLHAGDDRPFRVWVRNDGTEHWPGDVERRPCIRVAYHWLTPSGVTVQPDGVRTALPHPLAPGESGLVAMNVIAPPVPGRYVLAPDLVHEGARWFGCQGGTVEIAVTAGGVAAP